MKVFSRVMGDTIDKTGTSMQKERSFRGDRENDLHIMRFYSSYVSISRGKVVNVSEPVMRYCPLAEHFYPGIKRTDKNALREEIKKIVEKKINEYGFFTRERRLFSEKIAVPYGASEILMFAMKNKVIEAAVMVCDGAGTVIVNDPLTVQGIGARMNGIFRTSPIKRTIDMLRDAGCVILSADADIDQIEGVRKAAEMGYAKIAVTVNASVGADIRDLRRIERQHGVSVCSLAVCTTGISAERARDVAGNFDIIWSCASGEARIYCGRAARLQVSRKIPVFVMTDKGLAVVNSYIRGLDLSENMIPGRQYLIDAKPGGKSLRAGVLKAYLKEDVLPRRDKEEPIT